jgi:DNA (cytosine-5)-methyltransferase 1
MNFKLGEFFCGPGGIALGAKYSEFIHNHENYSIEHCWANDYDSDTCNTFRLNICPENPDSVICADVKDLDINALDPIDAFAFGFPCNDFSIVGEQKGINGNYGPLYTYGIKVLNQFQPKFFLAENVGGLKNSNEGSAFKKILLDLREAGYDVYPHLYKFEEYEVPQARHRIIIVGIRRDLELNFKIPKIENNRIITSREAIENPPILESFSNNELTKQSINVVERLKHIKPGENAFTATLPPHLELNVKGAKISQIYKRLDPNKPSYTVTGSGGGGTHVYHWFENRALTNRERARLQTFPDEFVFAGSKESVRKQIGMAVPPKGAKVIFEAVLKTFAGIDYPHVKPNITL